MRFKFSTFNHCPVGQIAVADIVQIMAHQLRACGHSIYDKPAEPFLHGADGFNVILENFVESHYTETVEYAWKHGCRFIFVATEDPTPAGFNGGLAPAMVVRQERFAEAAQYASAILHLVPGQRVTDWYGQFAPSACAELGYAPTLVRPNDITPYCNFGFFGQETSRRLDVFNRLGREKMSLILGLDTPCDDRDALMRCARVIVQIRANEESEYVSSSRCSVALHIGRPVIAEPHPDRGRWDGVIHFAASSEEFYKDAESAAREWRLLHVQQFQSFKAELTPEVCIGEPLRRIGITL